MIEFKKRFEVVSGQINNITVEDTDIKSVFYVARSEFGTIKFTLNYNDNIGIMDVYEKFDVIITESDSGSCTLNSFDRYPRNGNITYIFNNDKTGLAIELTLRNDKFKNSISVFTLGKHYQINFDLHKIN